MANEKEKMIKKLKELSPEELEAVSGGTDPFADVFPFWFRVYKDGKLIDRDGISFSEYWRTLGYVRDNKARYYYAPAASFHFYKPGTKIEYNYDLTARDNGIKEYSTIDAYIE